MLQKWTRPFPRNTLDRHSSLARELGVDALVHSGRTFSMATDYVTNMYTVAKQRGGVSRYIVQLYNLNLTAGKHWCLQTWLSNATPQGCRGCVDEIGIMPPLTKMMGSHQALSQCGHHPLLLPPPTSPALLHRRHHHRSSLCLPFLWQNAQSVWVFSRWRKKSFFFMFAVLELERPDLC